MACENMSVVISFRFVYKNRFRTGSVFSFKELKDFRDVSFFNSSQMAACFALVWSTECSETMQHAS